MELSAVDNANRQSQTYAGASGQTGTRATDSMFADLLLGIAAPSGDDPVSEAPFERDEPRDSEPEDTKTEASADSTGESKPKKSGRAVTAELADPFATPAFGKTVESKTVAASATVETSGIAIQDPGTGSVQTPDSPAIAGTVQSGTPNMSPAASPLANTAAADAATAAATTQGQAQAAAGAKSAESQALAKRAGAIEANQAHKDAMKGQSSGQANPSGNDAKAANHAATADPSATGQAKAGEAGTPTSDIARMEQALRLAFPNPQAASGAATPGTLAQPATQTSADALLSTRGGDSAIDAASASANGNNRANAATAAAKNASARPAFTLPNGRPAEQVSVQIQNGIRNGADRINIKLTPANLGNVEVKLEMAPDKTVQAIVYAEKAETLDMLERDGRVLQKALEEAGMRTNPDSLSFQHRDPGQSANAGHDGDRSTGTGSQNNGNGQDNADASATSDIPVQVRRSHDGLIDIEA